jgi:hypothetical protein
MNLGRIATDHPGSKSLACADLHLAAADQPGHRHAECGGGCEHGDPSFPCLRTCA